MISQGKITLTEKTDCKDQLKISISGDFCPINRIETLCHEKNSKAVFNDAINLLKGNDISITNLECPLTDTENPILKEGPSLIAHPVCAEMLPEGGISAVSLANNHIMDQGAEGLFETIKACKKNGIQTFGAGENLAAAAQPLMMDVKNTRVAFLTVAEKEFSEAGNNTPGVNPLDPVKNFYQIRDAQQTADMVFLIVHGGNEHSAIPSPQMVDTCRFFADLGVSAIICHHTHHASGFELHNNVPIFYSLGNFIFDYKIADRYPHWSEGYWVAFNISEKVIDSININPYVQCKNDPGIYLMQGKKKETFLNKINEYSTIIQNDSLLSEYWKTYCQKKQHYYFSNLFRLNKLQRYLLRKQLYFSSSKKQNFLLRMFNFFNCDAHRSVILENFQNEIKRLKR